MKFRNISTTHSYYNDLIRLILKGKQKRSEIEFFHVILYITARWLPIPVVHKKSTDSDVILMAAHDIFGFNKIFEYSH